MMKRAASRPPPASLRMNANAITPMPPAWSPVLLWLCFMGLVSFAVFLSWRADLLAPAIAADVTNISALICGLFVVGSVHCGARLGSLSGELARVSELNTLLISAAANADENLDEQLAERDGLAAAFFLAVRDQSRLVVGAGGGAPYAAARNHGAAGSYVTAGAQASAQSIGELAALLAEQSRRQHDAGWFLAGLLVKLGLLGTVVGFVIMLRSVDAIESFDVTDVQRVLTLMSAGMGVALYTTLVGLVTSIVLGFQYLCADQAANRLVAVTAETALRQLPRPSD